MAQYEIEVDSQDEYHDEFRAPQIKSEVVKKKGRGFSSEEPSAQVLSGIKHFDSLKEEVSGRAQRCKNGLGFFLQGLALILLLAVEGWVVFVTGLNDEVSEEEVEDKFSDFGKVREVRMNLDHRTGYVKVSGVGYTTIQTFLMNDFFRATR